MSVVFHVQKLLHVTKFVIKTAGQGYSFKIIVETGNWARTYGWEPPHHKTLPPSPNPTGPPSIINNNKRFLLMELLREYVMKVQTLLFGELVYSVLGIQPGNEQVLCLRNFQD